MTIVRNRRTIAYRPDADTLEYLEKLHELNPDISLNQRVDALVRYAMKGLRAKETLIRLRAEIEETDQ